MSKIENGGLDQYGAECFEEQQFGTAGIERVKMEVSSTSTNSPLSWSCKEIHTE